MNKLAQLIQAAPLGMEEIAARSNLTLARVRALRSGETATLEELRLLARGLRVPLRAFSEKEKSDSTLSILFRQKAGTKPDLGVEALTDFVEAALSILPPRSALPKWIQSKHKSANTYNDAQLLAAEFREQHVSGLWDPLSNLPQLLIQLGGIILGRLNTSRFEGASLIVDGYAFIFVSPRFAGRMLFTLAHELGHVLAHHRNAKSAIFDLASQIGNVRHANKTESFADAFASNLLMPREGVAIALSQIRAALQSKVDALGDIEILYLALFYGVSFEVAARRCEQLELLPEGGAYSLFDHVKKNYGGPEKLADKLSLPARMPIDFPRASSNILNAAIEKLENGDISIGWITDRLGISASDIYSVRAARELVRGNIR